MVFAAGGGAGDGVNRGLAAGGARLSGQNRLRAGADAPSAPASAHAPLRSASTFSSASERWSEPRIWERMKSRSVIAESGPPPVRR